jgi:hypothetical protein
MPAHVLLMKKELTPEHIMRLGLGFGHAFQKDWNDGAIKDLSAALDRHLSVA